MDYARLASYYQLIERCSMGKQLHTARTRQFENLSQLTPLNSALLIGEGDGSFLISFVTRFPSTQITVIEHSAAMVQRARSRLIKAGLHSDRIKFIVSGLLQQPLEANRYDLIVTHFFFDNFQNATVQRCIDHILPVMTNNAYWLVSDFCIPESGWQRWRALFWLKVLYLFFRQTAAIAANKLPDTEALLATFPLQQINRQTNCADMLFSSLYQKGTDSASR